MWPSITLRIGQATDLESQGLAPVWITREEVAVPPDGSRFEGDSFSIPHPWEEPCDEPHHPRAHQGTAQRPDSEDEHQGAERAGDHTKGLENPHPLPPTKSRRAPQG